jgi:hypothetical protein
MQPFENFQKHFFLNSNLRKVSCVAYFVVLRREPIKWAHCINDCLIAVGAENYTNVGCAASLAT